MIKTSNEKLEQMEELSFQPPIFPITASVSWHAEAP